MDPRVVVLLLLPYGPKSGLLRSLGDDGETGGCRGNVLLWLGLWLNKTWRSVSDTSSMLLT